MRVTGGGRSYASGGASVSCWTIKLTVSNIATCDKDDLQSGDDGV